MFEKALAMNSLDYRPWAGLGIGLASAIKVTIGGKETLDTVASIPESAWVLTQGAFEHLHARDDRAQRHPQIVTELVASNWLSCRMTTGRGLPA